VQGDTAHERLPGGLAQQLLELADDEVAELLGRVVPDEYMNFNMDIFIMRDRAFFVGLEQKIVIVVRLAPMVEALRGIYGALAGLGRPIDLNAYLRALIEKRGGKK